MDLLVTLCLILAVILLGAVAPRPLAWVVLLLGILALLGVLTPHLLR